MDRALDPTCERARARLEAVLDEFDFQLAAEYHLREAFGSAEAEYKRRGLRVRLTWDGRDRSLWFEVAPASGPNVHPLPGAWQDLESASSAASSLGRMLRDEDSAPLPSGVTSKRVRPFPGFWYAPVPPY
jgi:hypothetical protein